MKKRTLFAASACAMLSFSLFIISCDGGKKQNESSDSTLNRSDSVTTNVQQDSAKFAPDHVSLDTVSFTTTKSLSLSAKADQMREMLAGTYKSIKIGREIYYIVEGDILMDYDELYQYSLKLLSEGVSPSSNKLTVGLDVSGNILKWPENQIIKYSVLKNSFRTQQEYAQTVANMRQATQDWMKACNVRFQYVPALDNGSVGGVIDTRLTFAVRQFQANGYFAAMAFFPNDPPTKRKILLDYSFFNMQESQAAA